MPEQQALTATFGPLAIEHDGRVLEPRPWTQMQSRWAAELVVDAPPGPVLELCTGAGHIGLLAAHLSGRRLVAVDVDEVACDFARRNAARAGLTDLVDVRQGPMDTVLTPHEQFVLVVADPPWVRSTELHRYPEDPVLAIDGGDDGLAVARLCLDVAARHVEPGAPVLLQVGTHAQADGVASGAGWREQGRREGERGVVVHLTPSGGRGAGG